jgi:hypothetical protein
VTHQARRLRSFAVDKTEPDAEGDIFALGAASLAMNDVARPNKNPDNGIFWFWATGYPYQTTGRRPLKVDAATLSSV